MAVSAVAFIRGALAGAREALEAADAYPGTRLEMAAVLMGNYELSDELVALRRKECR